MELDASEMSAGTVLSQCFGKNPKLHPVALYSKKLTPTDRDYDTGNQELLAIKLAIEAADPFIVFTDHKNLEYLETAK